MTIALNIPLLECEHLIVRRDGRMVLNVDHLAVLDGETLAVIGPNGAGKTTLLLALAGLLPPTEGEIRCRGRIIGPKDDLGYRRRIGLVLQDPLLLDRSVKENVAIGLHFRHLPGDEINHRVDIWLENLGIAHLRQRSARQLSGGEAQRVSLARAFALQPEVLLLDEPFSALDAPTRVRLLDDLQILIRQTHTTTFFVTHNLDEALLLGDRVAVLLDGRLRQAGPPEAVFAMPADPDVAAFVGVENIVAGRIVQSADGLLSVEAYGQSLQAVGELSTGRDVVCCLRPEDVTLWAGDHTSQPALPLGEGGAAISSARNRLTGVITRITPQGPLARVAVDCGFPLVALITRASLQHMGLREGQPVTATFKASALHVIGR